jgi:hypothetical protein
MPECYNFNKLSINPCFLLDFSYSSWKNFLSRTKPVGIFQRPTNDGAQCFSCTTRTCKIVIRFLYIRLRLKGFLVLVQDYHRKLTLEHFVVLTIIRIHSYCYLNFFVLWDIEPRYLFKTTVEDHRYSSLSLKTHFCHIINKNNNTSFFSLMTNPPTPTWCDALSGSMQGPSGIQYVNIKYPRSAWWYWKPSWEIQWNFSR